MKQVSILLILCILVGMLPLSVIAGDVITEDDVSLVDEWPYVAGVDYVDGEVIVSVDYLVNLEYYSNGKMFDFHGVAIVGIEFLMADFSEDEIVKWVSKVGDVYTYKILLHSSASVQNSVSILNLSDNVYVAEPNYIFDIGSEPVYEDVSGTLSISASIDQWEIERLEIDDVWSHGFTGTSDVIVAVIDNGFFQHDELEENVDWENAYDVVSETNDVTPLESDDSNHGIMCAGIIGADNGGGYIDGVCKDITILPIKLHSYTTVVNGRTRSSFTPADMSKAVRYAILHNANILSISQSMSFNSDTVRLYISMSNVICVTSAGNNNSDMASDGMCKGKRHDDTVWLVVGALNSDGQRWVSTPTKGSNYNSRFCDIFAPGDLVLSLHSTAFTKTSVYSGTSCAAPYVAAACALIMSHATHLDAEEVVNLIISTDNAILGFDNYCVSGGELSIKNAIEYLYTKEDRGAYTKGDLNGDGFVDQFDYTVCRQIYMEAITPSSAQLDAGDVNNDGIVDTFDCLMIQNFYYQTYYFPPY